MSKTFNTSIVAGLILGLALVADGAETPAKFLGASSCASTSCHGGGSAKQNQFLVWSLQDFHAQRPTATLTTARSKQIAEALDIKDPTADARCTACHAPLHVVPEPLRGAGFKVSEGVSCESCHGPAEQWIRAHTRRDWTRADRTAAGMRDLQSLYVRANTCVACHQVVSQPLLKAGHPELIFELDGQSVAEPKHWSAEKNGNGAQAWFVGQAVAWRELSWQLAQESPPDEKLIARWQALRWLMQKLAPMNAAWPSLDTISTATDETNLATALKTADELARRAAAETWPEAYSRQALERLATSSDDFQNVTAALAARRAERLVLALDRLLAAPQNPSANAELNQLFKLAQSGPDFEPKRFTSVLQQFSIAIAPKRTE